MFYHKQKDADLSPDQICRKTQRYTAIISVMLLLIVVCACLIPDQISTIASTNNALSIHCTMNIQLRLRRLSIRSNGNGLVYIDGVPQDEYHCLYCPHFLSALKKDGEIGYIMNFDIDDPVFPVDAQPCEFCHKGGDSE